MSQFQSNAQQFKVNQIAPLFKKSFNQVGDFIASKGYSYIGEERVEGEKEPTLDYRYTVSTGYYSLSTLFKNDRLSIFSNDEFLPEFNNVILDLMDNGYTLVAPEEFVKNNTPPHPIPSALFKYVNKQLKITCTIVCPYDLGNGTMMFHINYSPRIF